MDAITAKLVQWLLSLFGGNIYLTTVFVSMVPMVEVRGAIPIATSLGMSGGLAYLVSALSALIVCPILVLLLRPILNALKKTKLFKRMAESLEKMFRGRAAGIEKKAENRMTEDEARKATLKKNLLTALGVFAFVAIPLPMTGVWTGSAIAAFISLKYRYSIPAIVIGNFTAAGIIALLDLLLGDYSYIILIVLAAFMVISVASILVTLFVKNKKMQAEMAENAEQNGENDEK